MTVNSNINNIQCRLSAYYHCNPQCFFSSLTNVHQPGNPRVRERNIANMLHRRPKSRRFTNRPIHYITTWLILPFNFNANLKILFFFSPAVYVIIVCRELLLLGEPRFPFFTLMISRENQTSVLFRATSERWQVIRKRERDSSIATFCIVTWILDRAPGSEARIQPYFAVTVDFSTRVVISDQPRGWPVAPISLPFTTNRAADSYVSTKAGCVSLSRFI